MIHVLLVVLVVLLLVAVVALVMAARRHREALAALTQRLGLADEEARQQRVRADGLAEERARLEARGERIGVLDARIVDLEGQLCEAAELRLGAERRVAELDSRLLEKEKAAIEMRERLTTEFENLSQRILDDRVRQFSEHSEKQLGTVLDPFKTQLKEFREKVEQTYSSEQRERGMLSQEINTLKQLNQRISEDAINLTRALKGESQTQGAWGEMVLERVLEASGLQSGREYETQVSYTDDDGSRARPDVVVHLPDEKDLVIDAKVSLVAYERCSSAADEPTRVAALREHVASIRRHVDGLSARSYTDVEGLRTLDFVLMFIPVEAAFIEAVRADDGLYTYALSKNVSIVSPSTLLATLRTVAHLWRIERRNVNAVEIARRGAMLHDNFALLIGELETLGTQLDRAQKAHAGALRRLTEGGKGSVILQVKSLEEMGVPAKKALSRSLLDQAGADVDEAGAGPDEDEAS